MGPGKLTAILRSQEEGLQLVTVALAGEEGIAGRAVPSRPPGSAEEAAQQENATAQRLLSQAYASGNGAPQDPQKATFWCQKAASNGDTIAQITNGHLE